MITETRTLTVSRPGLGWAMWAILTLTLSNFVDRDGTPYAWLTGIALGCVIGYVFRWLRYAAAESRRTGGQR